MKIISNDATMLSVLGGVGAIAGPLISLFIALYGFWRFWPNFVEQKRIENLSISAKETLDILTEAEGVLQKLHFAAKHHGNEKQHLQAQFEVSFALNKLHNALLLLRRNPHVPDVMVLIQSIIKTLNDDSLIDPSSRSITVLTELSSNWMKSNWLDAKVCSDIRRILLNIYEYKVAKTANVEVITHT